MTTPMHRTHVEMPPQVAALARDKHGRPIPAFVEYINGEPDFRVMSSRHLIDCVRFDLCWVCGQRRGRYVTFVIGPMCAVNRISAEPPSHKDCALYSARACPFLSRPNMVRRERNMPVKGVVAGMMIERNPGVGLCWTTKSFTWFKDGNKGLLFQLGEPVETSWWCEGRPATRAEVLKSIDSGLPLLKAADDYDPDALAEIDVLYQRALKWIPAA